MSVKSKIQALITAANAKTGKSDTDLTAAVQSLIDGYGAAVEQISFTIEGTTCTANAGQTFSEWVGSGYKTIENGMVLSVHPYSDEGVIFLDEAGVYALSLDGNTPVHGGDRIISGATYVAMNWGG